MLSDVDATLGHDLIVAKDDTSYSIIISLPGTDRMILHCPGANHSFDSDDLPDSALEGTRILHVGYLPLMRAMYQRNGESLKRLLLRAKSVGLATSLDTAYPGPGSDSQVSWLEVLKTVLPLVDFFLPSFDELCIMLGANFPDSLARRDRVRQVAIETLALGAQVVGIKLGEDGFYLRSTPRGSDSPLGNHLDIPISSWSQRELWGSAFKAHVVGTTGAGDAAIAGFLAGLLHGMTPEGTLNAACAVGAASVERADASSGIPNWEAIEARLRSGWDRAAPKLGADWREIEPGVWSGPDDHTSATSEVRKT